MTELTILLVEDDDGHAVLIQRSLRPVELPLRVVRVADGKKALDFVHGPERKTVGGPLVIFLDLNLPVVDGYQVLHALKTNVETRRIPVVVITTTDDRREMEKCYDLGANAYISKPMEFERFSSTMQNLGRFLSVITIPNGAPPSHA